MLDEQKSEIRFIHIVAAVLLCSSSKFITLGIFVRGEMGSKVAL